MRRLQAYEGLQTAHKLRQEYVFVPSKVKDVYLAHLLGDLEALAVRSAIVFCSTCAGAHLLAAVLAELALPCVALHSHKSQKRRLAALHTFKAGELSVFALALSGNKVFAWAAMQGAYACDLLSRWGADLACH